MKLMQITHRLHTYEARAESVQASSVDAAQGYYLSRPQPVENLEQIVIHLS